MKVTGTLINYYFHCKRQCYLFGNRLNLEDNSETVNIGKILNEERADNENTEIEIQRLKQLLATSQVSNVEGGKTVVKADTIHFTNRLSNSLELIKQANEVITPVPVNYKNACLSGWVD